MSPTSLRLAQRARTAVTVGVVGASLAAGLVAAPAAHAANCTYGAKAGRQMGASYVTSIRVTGVKCSAGIRTVKAFHACRKANGGVKNGRCPARKRVSGYRCTEKRGKTYQGQFSSKVTCRSGKRTVVHTFSNFV